MLRVALGAIAALLIYGACGFNAYFDMATYSVTETSAPNDFVFTLIYDSAVGYSGTLTMTDGSAESTGDYEAWASGIISIPPGPPGPPSPDPYLYTITITGDDVVELNEIFTLTLAPAAPGPPAPGPEAATVTITNDDTATLSWLTPGSTSIAEGIGGGFDFSVVLTGLVDTGITVTAATADGTAVAASGDYTAPAPQTFDPSTTVFHVDQTDDLISEEYYEWFYVDITGTTLHSRNVVWDGVTRNSGTIVNDDTAEVSFSAAAVPEGGAGTTHNVVFTIVMSSPVDTIVDVTLTTAAGSASSSTDFESVPSAVVHVDGSTLGYVTVTVTGDALIELNEYFSLQVTGVDGHNRAVSFSSSGQGTILNDDTATLSLHPPAALLEGTDVIDYELVLTVTLSGQFDTDVDVTIDQDALGADDDIYVDGQSPSSTATFAAGSPSGSTGVLSIMISRDQTVELNEVHYLVPMSTAYFDVDPGAAVPLTLLNDDTATISLDFLSYAMYEDPPSNYLTFTVVLDGEVDTDIIVRARSVGQTAQEGTDYDGGDNQLRFNGTAGGSRKRGLRAFQSSYDPFYTEFEQTYRALADDIVELDERLQVQLTAISVAGRAVSMPVTQATLTIQNDDTGVYAVSDASGFEGSAVPQSFVFTVSLSHLADTAVSHSYTVGGPGSGTDFTAIPTTSLPLDSIYSRVTVNILPDFIVELNEVFTMDLVGSLSAHGRNYIASVTRGYGYIFNDDTAVVTLAGNTGSEGAGTVSFSVTSTRAIDTDILVAGAITPSTAVSSDYTTATPSTTLTSGATSVVLPVPLVDDTVAELDEVFYMTFGASNVHSRSVVFVGGTGSAGTIQNDDVAVFSVSSTLTMSPLEGAGSRVFSLVTSQGVDTAVSATLTVVPGTALTPTDYSVGGSGPTDVTVNLAVDETVELDEVFYIDVTAFNAHSRSFVLTTRATVTILNDDTTTVNVGSLPVSDGSGGVGTAMVFTVALSHYVDTDVLFSVTTTSNSAVAGSDFQAVSGSPVIAAGLSSSAVTVMVTGSDCVEIDETFFLDVTPSTHSRAFSTFSRGTGTILADDVGVVSVGDLTQLEGTIRFSPLNYGTTNFVFAASFDKCFDSAVSVTYYASDAPTNILTAAVPNTGLAPTVGLSVPVVADDLVEGNTTFTVVASVPGATVVRNGTGHVINDDDIWYPGPGACTPLDQATMINLTEVPSCTSYRPFDPNALDFFIITPSGKRATMSGTTVLSSDGLTVRFYPSGVLAPATTYTLSVAASGHDFQGLQFANGYSSTFTTIPDCVPPCSVHGYCLITNQCQCWPGWQGPTCSEMNPFSIDSCLGGCTQYTQGNELVTLAVTGWVNNYTTFTFDGAPIAFNLTSDLSQLMFIAPNVTSPRYGTVSMTNALNGAVSTRPDLVLFVINCLLPGLATINGVCVSCPEGAVCPGGGRMWPVAGYWSLDEYSQPGACALDFACPGALENYAIRADGSRDTSACDSASGYGGVFCSQCLPGFYRDNMRCRKCTTEEKSVDLPVLYAAAAVAVAFLSLGMVFLRVKRMNTWVGTLLILQQLIYVGRTASTYLKGSVGDKLSDAFRSMSVLLLDVEFIKPTCAMPSITFEGIFWGSLVAILVCAVILTGMAALHAVYVLKIRKTNVVNFKFHFLGRLAYALIVLAAIVYLQTCIRIFQAINCAYIGGQYLLMVQQFTTCYTGSHTPVGAIAWILLFLYAIGFPVIISFFLIRAWRRSEMHEFAVEQFGYLTEGLKDKFFWFRVIGIVNTLILAAFTVLFHNPSVKVFTCGTSFLYCYVLGGILWPYLGLLDNALTLLIGSANMIQIIVYFHLANQLTLQWIAVAIYLVFTIIIIILRVRGTKKFYSKGKKLSCDKVFGAHCCCHCCEKGKEKSVYDHPAPAYDATFSSSLTIRSSTSSVDSSQAAPSSMPSTTASYQSAADDHSSKHVIFSASLLNIYEHTAGASVTDMGSVTGYDRVRSDAKPRNAWKKKIDIKNALARKALESAKKSKQRAPSSAGTRASSGGSFVAPSPSPSGSASKSKSSASGSASGGRRSKASLPSSHTGSAPCSPTSVSVNTGSGKRSSSVDTTKFSMSGSSQRSRTST